MPVPPPPPPSRQAARPSWGRLLTALVELWKEYTWFTRGATLLMVVAALVNIATTASEDGAVCLAGPLCWMPPWLQRALGSDGTIALLTLAIALGIGVHIKVRLQQGLLDGSDHYDIGRALAYGYFSNFLVPALVLVRNESRRLQRPHAQRLRLRMVFPSFVGELDQFKAQVEPTIREKAGKRDLEGVYRTGGTLVRRSILVVSRIGPEAGEPVYFDFPTTLYTLHDYYTSWNTWLLENRKTPMDDARIAVLEQEQVNTFLRHLRALAHSSAGVYAVRDLELTQAELEKLFDDHFEHVHPDEMRALFAQPPDPGVSAS